MPKKKLSRLMVLSKKYPPKEWTMTSIVVGLFHVINRLSTFIRKYITVVSCQNMNNKGPIFSIVKSRSISLELNL